MTAVLKEKSNNGAAPDLTYLRNRYPLTVTNLGALPDREKWLGRIWRKEEEWIRLVETNQSPTEVIVRHSLPPGLPIEGEFDVVYSGGLIGLLQASVMSHRFKRNVMVFDAGQIGAADHDWNVSADELYEFERAGLFTNEETESAVVNRYRSAFMKFHDRSSRVKTPPLWVDGVLDIAVSADKLLSLAAQKIQNSQTVSSIASGMKFKRCWLMRERVIVELEDLRTGRHVGFVTRLFVDTTGPNSPVARFLDSGMSVTHVMPTVGTVAKGFARGEDTDTVDFSVGEILVSKEDAADHRQLMWEGFAGSSLQDEYRTYMFFYDQVNSPADKSLLGLFEHYFETLPQYKRKGAYWRVTKPVFGYVPGFNGGGRPGRTVTATDRVMLAGELAGPSNPLSFCGFGRGIRTLHRFTTLTEEVLSDDSLDAASLLQVSRLEPRVADAANLAELLRPTMKTAPSTVNETLNAVMGALHSLDGRVRRELLQDRMTFSALKNILSRTARIYPHIFQRLREHMGIKGTAWWFRDIVEVAWRERRERKGSAETRNPFEKSGD